MGDKADMLAATQVKEQARALSGPKSQLDRAREFFSELECDRTHAGRRDQKKRLKSSGLHLPKKDVGLGKATHDCVFHMPDSDLNQPTFLGGRYYWVEGQVRFLCTRSSIGRAQTF